MKKKNEIFNSIQKCNSISEINEIKNYLNNHRYLSNLFSLYDELKEKENKIRQNNDDNTKVNEDYEIYKKLSTKDNYYLFNVALDKLLTQNLNSVLVSGQGGTGKSYTVDQKLKSTIKKDGSFFKSIEEDSEEGDYLFITAHSSPKGLYNLLFKYRDNKIIVFDDCDNIFSDKDSLNILKAALDTKPERKIYWHSSRSFENNSVPNMFCFNSKIIFLTNIPKAKLDQALLTRTVFFNLYLTNEQLCERAESIKSSLLSNLDLIMQDKILDFVKQNCNNIHNFSLRTFLKINQLVNNNDKDYVWKNMILHIV